VPPDPTSKVTPLLMVKPLSVYPEAISSAPPALMVIVPLVTAPPRSSKVTPLPTVKPLRV
jgi:hypothetical protein